MSWARGYFGRVLDAGLIHVVYTHAKINRVYWTSQCNIQWAHRDNRDKSYAPVRTPKRATCLLCVALQLKHGWSW